MSWDDWIQCMACPDAWFNDREVYAAHVKTKWHLYNTNCRMMGNPTLNNEAYLAKFGDPTAVGSVAKDMSNQSEKQAEAKKEEEEAKAETPVEDDTVTVVVMFTYQEERWSHRFSVKRGSTIWELKQAMVKPDSPEEDVLSFSLKTGMIRAWNFETIESDETYEFQYIGPEEGQKFLDRDKLRKQRDDDEARERLEEEQRKQEERKHQEEERRRLEEERALEEKRKEEEEKFWREEEEKRRKHEEEEAERWRQWEEEERRKQEEEAERRRQEEAEAARRKEEEEAERRRQEEEEAERRRQEEEEAEARRKAEEEAERRRQAEEEERRRQEESVRLEQERQAEERRQAELQAQAPGDTVDVCVYIDRAMDFKTTVAVRRGAPAREAKQRLAEEDPTGQLRAEDIVFMDSSHRELGDDEQITQSVELDLKTALM